MNFGFSGEMVFIFFLALILFGPKKLPEMGRTVARFLNEFRRASNEFRSQIEFEIDSLDTNSSRHGSRPFGTPAQAPLGSLASRIFNPPPPEKMEAAEEAAAEQAAVKAAAEASVVEAEIRPENFPPNPPKVGPDA